MRAETLPVDELVGRWARLQVAVRAGRGGPGEPGPEHGFLGYRDGWWMAKGMR